MPIRVMNPTQGATERFVAGGQTCRYRELYKFIAPPVGAQKIGGVWYAADGRTIGGGCR